MSTHSSPSSKSEALAPHSPNGCVSGSQDTLSWQIVPRERVVTISLVGELDAYSALGLGDAVESLALTGRHLLVDLSRLRFCASAGLTTLIEWKAAAEAGNGSLYLVATPTSVRRVLAVTGLDTFFSQATNTEDALAILDPAAITGHP